MICSLFKHRKPKFKDSIKYIAPIDKVILKTKKQGTRIIESSDHRPRSILKCQFKVGDVLIVKFKEEIEPFEEYCLKG